MPDTLSSLCDGGLCRGATPNFSAEVAVLANKLEAKPISGKIVAPNGKLKTLRMDGESSSR